MVVEVVPWVIISVKGQAGREGGESQKETVPDTTWTVHNNLKWILLSWPFLLLLLLLHPMEICRM